MEVRFYEKKERKRVAVMDGEDMLLVTDIDIANKWVKQHEKEYPNAVVVDCFLDENVEDGKVAQEETPENEENI